MNTGLNIVDRLQLSEQELEDLKTALSRDKIIMDTVIKILQLRRKAADASKADYDAPNWPYRRAYKDGAQDELEFLLKLFANN
jgi:hypothetical protein